MKRTDLNTTEKVTAIFSRFIPKNAVPYCVKLYDHYGFEFKIKKARGTKLGDYRYDLQRKHHTITINNDLNPFAFLITYLHEVAHMANMLKHGPKVSPHGKEWKDYFVRIAAPVLVPEVFPPDILVSLNRYFKNPKAASCSDPKLTELLKKYDRENGKVLLKTLAAGDVFNFNGNTYQYLEKRRTRIICERKENRRKYLISLIAEVEKVES